MNSANQEVRAAIHALSDALESHAAACESAQPVDQIVAKAERAVEMARAYEGLLLKHCGWSNPIRHLGSPPYFRDVNDHSFEQEPSGARYSVRCTYVLNVADDDELTSFVSGRYGEEFEDPTEAIRILAESDGWNPSLLPIRGIRLTSAEVVVHPGTVPT